jgi:hypothetical protein
VEGSVHCFEVTEADRPGRKRNEEYKTESEDQQTRPLREDEWTTSEEYQRVIQKLCYVKTGKPYAPTTNLVVWSNAFGICDDHLMNGRWWQEACHIATQTFKAVFVHHQDDIFRVDTLVPSKRTQRAMAEKVFVRAGRQADLFN